jgi:hypothetical protein
MTDESFLDLKAALEWGSALALTDEQRSSLSGLCCKISGCVPRGELVTQRKKRQEAERRVAELEAALKASRNEWVFRRGKSESDTRAKHQDRRA